MMDKTESGISRRGIFSMIYCLPGFHALARAVSHHLATDDACVLVGQAWGGLAVLIAICTLALPVLLRRLGQVDRAASWRRAAFAGIGFGTTWTFMWTMLFLPVGSAVVRLGLGLAASAAALALLWWVDRRWLHLDVFKRR